MKRIIIFITLVFTISLVFLTTVYQQSQKEPEVQIIYPIPKFERHIIEIGNEKLLINFLNLDKASIIFANNSFKIPEDAYIWRAPSGIKEILAKILQKEEIYLEKVFTNITVNFTDKYFGVRTQYDNYKVYVPPEFELDISVPLLIFPENTRFELLDYELEEKEYPNISCYVRPLIRVSEYIAKKRVSVGHFPKLERCSPEEEAKILSGTYKINYTEKYGAKNVLPLIVEYSKGKAKFLKIKKLKIIANKHLTDVEIPYPPNIQYSSEIPEILAKKFLSETLLNNILTEIFSKNGYTFIPIVRDENKVFKNRTICKSSGTDLYRKKINVYSYPIIKFGKNYIKGYCKPSCGNFSWIEVIEDFPPSCEEIKPVKYKVFKISKGCKYKPAIGLDYLFLPWDVKVKDVVLHSFWKKGRGVTHSRFEITLSNPTNNCKSTLIYFYGEFGKEYHLNFKDKKIIINASEYVDANSFIEGEASNISKTSEHFKLLFYYASPSENRYDTSSWEASLMCKPFLPEDNLIPTFAYIENNTLNILIVCKESKTPKKISTQITYTDLTYSKKIKNGQKLLHNFIVLRTP